MFKGSKLFHELVCLSHSLTLSLRGVIVVLFCGLNLNNSACDKIIFELQNMHSTVGSFSYLHKGFTYNFSIILVFFLLVYYCRFPIYFNSLCPSCLIVNLSVCLFDNYFACTDSFVLKIRIEN